MWLLSDQFEYGTIVWALTTKLNMELLQSVQGRPLPDEVYCSTGKGITYGRPSPKQRAGGNFVAHQDLNR